MNARKGRLSPRGDSSRSSGKAAVWETLRAHYPEEAQAVGDAAAQAITIRDLIALELAEHGRLAETERAARAKEGVLLAAARVQSRKALRRLAIHMRDLGINLSPGVLPRPPDEHIAGTPAWARRRAQAELRPPDEILN